MGSGPNKIARSPTPPETDDDGEEWPVHGIVGEDVDVFGISSYEVRWQHWSRPDGTNTTWMRDIEGDPAFVFSWNEAMKDQRIEKARESQSMDLMLLATMPMHDRLTYERAQAVEEKMAERLRNGPPGKVYQGWMAEVDPQRRREKNPSSSTKSKKRNREPSFSHSTTEASSYAESSRSGALKKRHISATWNIAREGTSTASDGDISSDSDI